MIELKVVQHYVTPGKQMIKVWRDGVFVATIYPHQDGIRIVSKYMTDVIMEPPFSQGDTKVLAAVVILGEG